MRHAFRHVAVEGTVFCRAADWGSQFHMKASLSHIEWNAELFMSSAFKRSFLRFSLRLARSAWRAALCAALRAALCAALRASLRFARRVA